jgi:hypothetical protein
MQKDAAPSDAHANKSKPAFRPDLSQSMSVGNDSDRILTSLKSPQFQTGKSQSGRKSSFFGLALLLLAAAGAAFAGYFYWASQVNSRTDMVRMAQAASGAAASKSITTGDEKVAIAQPSTPVSPAAMPTPAPLQAAEIVNETLAPKEPAPTPSAETKLTDALEKDVKPPNATLQKALEGKPKQRTLLERAPTSKSVAQKPAGPASPVAQKTVPTAADKDINLIAALLAHNAASPSSAKQGATKPAATGATEVQPKNETSGASTNLPVAVARNDVTEAALKQCESLDFLQREVCKLKACDKLWETNPACKATLSSAK